MLSFIGSFIQGCLFTVLLLIFAGAVIGWRVARKTEGKHAKSWSVYRNDHKEDDAM